MQISPPTASKLLHHYTKDHLLIKDSYRNYLLFYANKESNEFIDLSRIYWSKKLKELLGFMEKNLIKPTIILFGSLSKAEVKADSDVDLAVFAHKKDLNIDLFEKKVKRKIHLLWFKSLKKIKNKELSHNILNGFKLKGRLSL